MDNINRYPELSPRTEKVLTWISKLGLLGGVLIPVLIIGYVFARIALDSQFSTSAESLTPFVTFALYFLLMIPLSMIISFVVAFVGGLIVRRPFWFNLKEALKHGFVIPRFITSTGANAGV